MYLTVPEPLTQRGHPCDGAMSRQFVVGAGIALWGVGVMAASVVFGIIRLSKRSGAKVTRNS
jgi:hypothetical protein